MRLNEALDDRPEPPARVGMLYPTRDCGEDDYVNLVGRIDPAIAIRVAYVEWPGGWDAAHGPDIREKMLALHELGSEHRLAAAAEELRGFGPTAVTWACNSASFLHGLAGARKQARLLSQRLNAPASSTSLGFLEALSALGISKVSVCSVYHEVITDEFIRFLADGGVQTVGRIDLNATSDRELATWDHSRLLTMAEQCNTDAAEAILIPETALHTADILDELETRTGRTVLTATQVTIWHTLQQLGRHARCDGLGTLFNPPAGAVPPIPQRSPDHVT